MYKIDRFRHFLENSGPTNGISDADSVTSKTAKLKQIVTNILLDLGVPANIKGYTYLREAIIFSVENPNAITSVTKVLYPNIAKSFDSSSTQVERAIRHAIEVAWNRNNHESRKKVFGSIVAGSNYKPTNSEFIATISDLLKLHIDSYSINNIPN